MYMLRQNTPITGNITLTYSIPLNLYFLLRILSNVYKSTEVIIYSNYC